MILKAQHKQMLRRLEHKSSPLKGFTHGDNGVGNVSVHYENYLNDLQNFGYVVSVDDVWHITGFGLGLDGGHDEGVLRPGVAEEATADLHD